MEFDDTNLNPCDMVCPEFFEPYVALRYPGLREFGPRRSSLHRFRFVAAAMSSCQVIKPLMSGLVCPACALFLPMSGLIDPQ